MKNRNTSPSSLDGLLVRITPPDNIEGWPENPTNEQCQAIADDYTALLKAIVERDRHAVTAILADPNHRRLARCKHSAGDNCDVTPLHKAVNTRDTAIVRLLIEAGAPLDVWATMVAGRPPITPLDCARITDQPGASKAVIRLLERESDRQGIDAESMQAEVERRPDGTVSLAVVNCYTGTALDYGRARLASDRAMNEPAIMGRIYDLMSDDRKVKVAPTGPTMH